MRYVTTQKTDSNVKIIKSITAAYLPCSYFVYTNFIKKKYINKRTIKKCFDPILTYSETPCNLAENDFIQLHITGINLAWIKFFTFLSLDKYYKSCKLLKKTNFRNMSQV